MKKILLLAIVSLLLFGCSGSNEPTSVTKACSIEQAGMNLTITGTAESLESDVKTATVSVSAPYSAMGITDEMVASLTDDMKQQLTSVLEESIVSSLGSSDVQGVEVTRSEFTDTGLEIEMTMDIAALLQESEGETQTLQSFVDYLTQSGFTCN